MTALGTDELSDEKRPGAPGGVLASNDAGKSRRSTNGRSPDRRMLKKSDLYRSLWKGADELRGGMDASQYKDYVLTLLFIKYISDRADKTLLDVPEGASWADITKLRDDKEIGDKINKIIARIAEANDLHGVIDLADFNDENKLGRGKEMVDRLSKLVGIFSDLDFGSNTAEGDDLLGDAYEYLMRHFATESGKSKGQFYTPAEVSMILARVVGIGPRTTPDQTVYDPTCGSGALLLKAASEAPVKMSVYGQEMDNATFALARMNMILHDYETAELWHGNTLSSPHYKDHDGSLKKFDFAVANPPFSTKAWTSGLNPAADEFGRFDGFGIPPAKNGDYAFLLHILKSLKSNGKAAIILPHGVLFRGNREADIRRELVRRRLIKGIIGLPANLFYGTGIPACVIVLDKEGTSERRGIFVVDASKGFIKDGNKNRLRAQDLHKIVDVFTSQTETEGYSRLVPFDEIESPANAYNLNLPRYIDSSEPEDIQDLNAHLNGGIPGWDIDALSEYWRVLPSLRTDLFHQPSQGGYCDLAVKPDDVRAAIVDHADFRDFGGQVLGRFDQWVDAQVRAWRELDIGGSTIELIHAASEELLRLFIGVPLVNRYDLYQHLMDYWADEMQDDAYLITRAGWLEEGRLLRACVAKEPAELVVKTKGRKAQKLIGELIPVAFLTSHFFSPLAAEVDSAAERVEGLAAEREAFEEEHAAEGGALDALGEDGSISRTAVLSRVEELKRTLLEVLPEESELRVQAKAIKKGSFGTDPWKRGLRDTEGLFQDLDTLRDYLELLNAETEAKLLHEQALSGLNAAILSKYPELTEAEIKAIVIEKWLASIRGAVEGHLHDIAERLAFRIRELSIRYSDPLPGLVTEEQRLRERVERHLLDMGLSWN